MHKKLNADITFYIHFCFNFFINNEEGLHKVEQISERYFEKTAMQNRY